MLGAGGVLLLGVAAFFIFFYDEEPIFHHSTPTSTASFDESDEQTEIIAVSETIKLDSYAAGSVIKITNAGDYVISGTLDDGQLTVEVGDEDKVQLYLDNAHIMNSTNSAVYVKNAKKVIITLNQNTQNSMSDGAYYADLSDEGEPNATIFSHDDLTINGTGSLVVTANYEDAIKSRDDLKITGGNINITAIDDGLNGNDSIEIKTANITITAGGDAIHTDGDMIIESGTFIINAEDDAMHADNTLTINDGNIDIQSSYEGKEATNVVVNGGTINIVADDDGLNGAGGNNTNSTNQTTASGRRRPQDNFSSNTGSITVNGGVLTIAAAGSGSRDGLDANGDITITGGSITFKTPSYAWDYEPLDHDGALTMTGGEVYIDGRLYTASTIGSVSGGRRR